MNRRLCTDDYHILLNRKDIHAQSRDVTVTGVGKSLFIISNLSTRCLIMTVYQRVCRTFSVHCIWIFDICTKSILCNISIKPNSIQLGKMRLSLSTLGFLCCVLSCFSVCLGQEEDGPIVDTIYGPVQGSREVDPYSSK